jgi:hypothetical protein
VAPFPATLILLFQIFHNVWGDILAGIAMGILELEF